MGQPRFTNRLIHESSPYLRQHAHNPVDWHPWGDEAIRKARELGRPIRYQPASVLGYMRHLKGQGLPAPQVLVQTILHTGLRRGQASRVDPTLAALLGHPPRTLQEYVHDHRTTWSSPTPATSDAT